MLLEPFIEWCDGTAVGTAIRSSTLLFPVIETTHMLGLALLLGSTMIVNARYFGVGMKRQTIAQVSEDFFPWTLASFGMMAVSGLLLLLAKAKDLYEHKGWRITTKLTFLALTLIFQAAIYPRLSRRPGTAKFAAGASLILWFATALAGLTLEFL